MYYYNKLIKEIRKDLYGDILYCVVFILVAIIFIIKDLFLIALCCVVITQLLFVKIIRFIKFRYNFLSPMKRVINQELQYTVIECSGCLFTENYIINKTAYWIIPYDDILLMNKQLSANGNWFCTRLYMVTKNDNYSFILYSSILYESNHELSEKVYQYIKTKNPNILIGDTEKNILLLEKKYNIKLPKNWKSKAENNE